MDEPKWPVYYYPDPNFSLDNHIRHLGCKISNHEDLHRQLTTLIEETPGFNRPPWEMLVCTMANHVCVVDDMWMMYTNG